MKILSFLSQIQSISHFQNKAKAALEQNYYAKNYSSCSNNQWISLVLYLRSNRLIMTTCVQNYVNISPI